MRPLGLASGDIFDAAIMTGPIGDVLASGQVVISSVKTLAGLKLSVTVRQGAPKPDISTLEAVKKALLNARSVAYVAAHAVTNAGLAFYVRTNDAWGLW